MTRHLKTEVLDSLMLDVDHSWKRSSSDPSTSEWLTTHPVQIFGPIAALQKRLVSKS